MSGGRVEDGAAGPTPLSSIRPDDIDRIEVIKGEAARATYGEDATAGVIQIFTKKREYAGTAVTARLRERPEAPDADASEESGLSGRLLDAAEWGLHGALRLIGRPAPTTATWRWTPSSSSSTSPDSPVPAAGSMEATPEEALVVVDGVVRSPAELEAIDPQRIDRVEVLKGAAARDEYGGRGANGVVRIFLKN